MYRYRLLWYSPDAPASTPAPAVGSTPIDTDRYKSAIRELKGLRNLVAVLQSKGMVAPQADGTYQIVEKPDAWKDKYTALEAQNTADLHMVGAGILHAEDRAFILGQYQAAKSKDAFDVWFAAKQKEVSEGKAGKLMASIIPAPGQTVTPPPVKGADGKPIVTAPPAKGAPGQTVIKPVVDPNAGVKQEVETPTQFTQAQIDAMDLEQYKANRPAILKQQRGF